MFTSAGCSPPSVARQDTRRSLLTAACCTGVAGLSWRSRASPQQLAVRARPRISWSVLVARLQSPQLPPTLVMDARRASNWTVLRVKSKRSSGNSVPCPERTSLRLSAGVVVWCAVESFQVRVVDRRASHCVALRSFHSCISSIVQFARSNWHMAV